MARQGYRYIVLWSLAFLCIGGILFFSPFFCLEVEASATSQLSLDIYEVHHIGIGDDPLDRAGRLGEATSETDRLLYLAHPPMTGEDVRELQLGLELFGLYTGPLTGRFDRGLMESVQDFQREHGLVADGVVGNATWQALCDNFPIPVVDDVQDTPQGEKEIVIDVARRQLTVYIDGKEHRRFAVAVGLSKTPSPIGEFRIVHKSMNWGGGFGTRWLGLNVPWGIYGIHGTNKPWSIGTMASGGCIRMFNGHVEYLYRIIPEGTLVRMVGRDPDGVNRTLKPGNSGQDVIALQFALREKGFDAGQADGHFGPQTANAIKEVQNLYGLLPDGVGWPDVYLLLGVDK